MASVHLLPSQEPRRHLTDFPDILAPSPFNRDEKVLLRISPNTIEKLVAAHRRTSLFEAWAHLVGCMPPVNNAELVRRTNFPDAEINHIADAAACFKGIKRRHDDDNNGSDIYVYSIVTPYTVRWQSSMQSVAGIVPAPDQTVLTVLVRPQVALQGCQDAIWGTVIKWEFVNANPDANGYPDSHDSKYDALMW